MASKLSLFLAELKRRKVTRVAVVYALVGLGVIEAASMIFPALFVPEWAFRLVVALILLGFPIALVLAWALEVTPQGIQKTPDLTSDQLASRPPEPLGASNLVLLGAGLVVVLAAGYFVFFEGETESSLPEDYVAVFPFENLTGNSELDQLGPLAAFLITDGLGWIEEVREVATTTVLQAVAARREHETIRDVAVGLGAGTAVTGVYSMNGDRLEVRAEVMRVATGELIRSEENSGSALEFNLTVDDLRQRIASGFAFEAMAEGAEVTFFTRAPTLDALQAWRQGMTLFANRNWAASLPHLHEAYRLDPTFLQSLIWALAANLNMGRHAAADSLVKILEPQRDELSPRDRPWLDRYVAFLQGDWEGTLQSARIQAQQDPAGWGYSQANVALEVGRPEEALEALGWVDPDHPFTEMWSPYWTRLAMANHDLGRYEEALDAASRGSQRFPDYLELSFLEVQALIGMGRVDQVDQLLGQIGSREPDVTGWSPGQVFLRVAASFARFGHGEESRQVAERALDWYQVRDPDAYQQSRAQALLLAERPEEALALLGPLVAESPQNLPYHGLYGIALALTNDSEGAEAEAGWCENLDRPYLRGSNTYWQAAILAHLDRPDEATRLLRTAHQRGRSNRDLLSDPNFMPLWDYEPFEQLLAPKG